jgi:uncharacterized membrane protein
MEEIKEFDPKDIEENRVLASLSYICILFIVPLIVKRESKFCVENAKQGLVLFIAEIIVWVLSYIPILGWIIGIICGAALFIIALIAFIYTISGKFWKVPFVYDFAKSFKF